MGAKPIAAMATTVIPPGKIKNVKSTLSNIMAGGASVLNEENCQLVGGHTTESESTDSPVTFGFSVTGIKNKNKELMTKGGMLNGDILLLTKPLGTGIILAANMRGACNAVWLKHALRSMDSSNGPVSEVLQQNGCVACTDVTGFGLWGHLHEMCKASQVEAVICLDKVPTLSGATELVKKGFHSSLHNDNMRLKNLIYADGPDSIFEHKNFPLLFDPQTSGGLLACIKEKNANTVLKLLQGTPGGSETAIIGYINSEYKFFRESFYRVVLKPN
eukprot:GHVL01036924.1.p1 GENE.GHVL01036924.1~~GHVL01036924.1.p1  ORF type:complete len:274 (-),score=64.35 GHVL01036924.1:626-1447(-)